MWQASLVYAVILSELMQNKPLICSLLLITQLRMLSFIKLVIVAWKVHDFQDGFQFWNRSRVSLKAKYELRKKVLNLIRYNQFLKKQRSSCCLLGGEYWERKGKEWENGAERGDRYQPLKAAVKALGEMKTVPVGIAGTWVCKVMGVFRGKPEAASWLLLEMWEVM